MDLVVLSDDATTWDIVRSGLTEDQAENLLDEYSERFPHAIYDIIPDPCNLQT
jgi:hypothetical protein